jgi:hypothetical protein
MRSVLSSGGENRFDPAGSGTNNKLMETGIDQNSQVTQPLVGAHSCGAAGTLARERGSGWNTCERAGNALRFRMKHNQGSAYLMS